MIGISTYRFLLVTSADSKTALTGAAPTVSLAPAGGAFAAAANAASEVGQGFYELVLTMAERNTSSLTVIASAAGSDVWRDILYADPALGAGAIAFTYTLTRSDNAQPIGDAAVWATTDSAGVNIVASGTTDAFGEVVFYLDTGTYYIWRAKVGYTFSNPDTEIVS